MMLSKEIFPSWKREASDLSSYSLFLWVVFSYVQRTTQVRLESTVNHFTAFCPVLQATWLLSFSPSLRLAQSVTKFQTARLLNVFWIHPCQSSSSFAKHWDQFFFLTYTKVLFTLRLPCGPPPHTCLHTDISDLWPIACALQSHWPSLRLYPAPPQAARTVWKHCVESSSRRPHFSSSARMKLKEHFLQEAFPYPPPWGQAPQSPRAA